jgi:very-short-patch-repair endonuclease
MFEIFSVAIIIFIIYFILTRSKKHKKEDNEPIKKIIKKKRKTPISHYKNDEIYSTALLMAYEQEYYFRLKKLIPKDTLIHTQVSFSAFLTSPEVRTRNKFNRAHADIVITDLNFNVLLIIEIDGSSHRCSRVQERDKKRDHITASAGLPTLRIDDGFSDQEIAKLISQNISSQLKKNKKNSKLNSAS